MRTLIIFLLIYSASPAVFAHPGHEAANGLIAGLLHPWLGWDHCLAMLGMGASAAMMRRAHGGWIGGGIALALCAGMLGAAALGQPASIEWLLAMSVSASALWLWRDGDRDAWRMAAMWAFAGLHGAAHGIAAPSTVFAVYALGVAGSSLTLFGLGWLAGRHGLGRSRAYRALASGLFGVAGIGLLFSV